MTMTPTAWKFVWTPLALIAYVAAAFMPEAKAMHLNELATLIVGAVWLARPGDAGKAAAVLLLALMPSLMGCSGSFEEARNPSVALGAPPQSQRCADLDDRHALWGGVAKTSAVLAGGSGLATIPVEQDEVRIGLAVGAATMGAVAAGSGFISEAAAASWANECAH